MALSISCILSGIFTFYTLGLTLETVPVWLGTWVTAFCIAVPVAVAVRPIAQWIANSVTKPPSADEP
ncbi:DUF2798 domain-containing protein [Jannaschia sp. CCS1]|uniref:DUF2798 domain-containing protein n=1 Tax=Jannaschia sp. (strain CCS1) TaxID=290400 RepID=UPI0002EAA127